MNHYYAEFHAHDRMEQFHREAYASQRALQVLGRRVDRSTNRATSRALLATVFLFAAILVGLIIALPANAGRAFTDRIENVDSILAVASSTTTVGSIMRAELQTDHRFLALH